jgi:hypothetical protein
MTSWAAIARKDAEVSTVQQINWKVDKPQMAVVDANAIISGLRLAGGAQRAVTIQVRRTATTLDAHFPLPKQLCTPNSLRLSSYFDDLPVVGPLPRLISCVTPSLSFSAQPPARQIFAVLSSRRVRNLLSPLLKL